MSDDLKPCPFCGGEATLWDDPSHSAAWFVGCDDDYCFGGINWAETKAATIAAWNRRPKAAALDLTAEERLAKAVEALGACIASLERADTSEGVCCCGDNMEGHSDPMACGHIPVDMGDYYAQSALESARAILKEIDND